MRTMSRHAAPYLARSRWSRFRCDQNNRRNKLSIPVRRPTLSGTVWLVHFWQALVVSRKKPSAQTAQTGPPVKLAQPSAKQRSRYGHSTNMGVSTGAQGICHHSVGIDFSEANVCFVRQSAPLGHGLQIHFVLSSPLPSKYSGMPDANPLQSAIVVHGGSLHAVL